MASNTKNVKLGVCQVFFDGVDLGYTQGGVEVTVKTDTHKVNIDQFGKTSINEYIMGREVTAKVPLAETTVENMVAIMPGATMTVVGGTIATGTITMPSTAPTTGSTVTINGATVTFKTALSVPAVSNEVLIPSTYTAAAQALNFIGALNVSTDPLIAAAYYTATASVVTVTYGNQLIYGTAGAKSADGNAFTLAAGTSTVTVGAPTLTGGTEPTAKSVDVNTATGTDLLSIAKELRFHPVSQLATDLSQDFRIPLAATAGALNFAYKLENERVFNVDFTGYPDPTTGKLFITGR